MTVLYTIILGIVQGITEFLPVSSMGHLAVLQGMFGMERGTGILLETLLHLGTAIALILVFRRDVQRIIIEALGMLMDLIGNANLYFHNHRTGDNLHYTRIISNTYRKFTLLILISTIPTAILGYTARRLVTKAAVSPLIPGICMLVTGIILLVVDFSRAGGNKTPREATWDHAMWMGICQGLAVFPGLSSSGLSISAGLLCGFSRKFAVKYTYIMSIPAVLGAFLVEVGNFTYPTMNIGLGFTYILGMLVTIVTAFFSAGFLLKLVQHIRLRYFAFYSFAAGIIALAWNYL